MLVFGHAPNKIELNFAAGVATWVVISTDGVGYASLAALFAANKVPWPRSNGTVGLDPGMMLQSLTASTFNGTTDGSGFFLVVNSANAPTNAEFVSGGGQKFTQAGQVWNVWVKLTDGTDTLALLGQY